MTEQLKLEVTNKEEQLKSSVSEKQQKDVDSFIKKLNEISKKSNDKNQTPEKQKETSKSETEKNKEKEDKEKNKATEKIIKTFDNHWWEVIDMIKTNLETKKTLSEKEITDMNLAIKAFEDDIKTLDSGNKQLDQIKVKVNALKYSNILQPKKAELILNKTRTKETLESAFFESSNESDFNDTFDYVLWTWITTKILGAGWNDKKFQDMIKSYKSDEITDITLKLAEKTNQEYKEWTRLITFKENGEIKAITNKIQEKKAEKYAENLPAEIFWKDNEWKDLSWLNIFDNKWDHEAFKKFIENKWSDYVKNNLENIINWVGKFQEIDKKNHYSTTLSDFIATKGDKSLITEFATKYMKPENLYILWTDKETQRNNYKKITDSKNFQRAQTTFDGKITEQIINTKLSILSWEKISAENLKDKIKDFSKEWLTWILKAFWWVMLDIIELFWWKGLLKKFCSKFGIDYKQYAWDIEKLYNDKYWLSENQKRLLEKIFLDKEKNLEERSNWNNTITDRKWNPISYNKENIKTTYANTFSNEIFKDEQGNEKPTFLLLDPILVEKALQTDDIKNLEIEQKDNILIVEKWLKWEIIKKINPNIKALTTEKERQDIINAMITDSSREEIQRAWDKLSRSNRVYNSEIEDSTDPLEKQRNEAEKIDSENMKNTKWIKDVNDIWMYLWAYLMKWSWDLKYSISQTDLIPKPKIPTKTIETPEEAEKRINPWFLEYSNKKDFDKLFNITSKLNDYSWLWLELPESYFKNWSKYLYVESKSVSSSVSKADNYKNIAALSHKYNTWTNYYTMTKRDESWDISTITFAEINK